VSNKNSNRWFIIFNIGSCLLLSLLLIYLIGSTDRTLINIVTIAGTILTIGALVFTIREQLKIKRISKAIQENTSAIQNKLVEKAFDWNVDRSLKCLNDLNSAGNDGSSLVRIHLRLTDLSESLIECKKSVNLSQGYLSQKCLEQLRQLDRKALTPEKVLALTKEIEDQCKTDRTQKLADFILKISAYSSQIQVANFLIDSIKDRTKFVEDITEMRNFLLEIKRNHLIDLT
jgi:hypothetical protein